MPFNNPASPGKRAFIELQNENKTSLAHRSHSELSGLCRSVGVLSEGTSSELITRLLSLKLSIESNNVQTSAQTNILNNSFKNDSWLNNSGNILNDDRSFGLSNLTLNESVGVINRNFIHKEASHPLPIIPVKQPNKNSFQASFSPSFSDFSISENSILPTNPFLAASKLSSNALGTHPDYINQPANTSTFSGNNPFSDQTKASVPKIDHKAEHISLTIETEELLHTPTQKSTSTPFPFPLKEDSHISSNQHNTELQKDDFFQAGSLPKISQPLPEFKNASSFTGQNPFNANSQFHNSILNLNEVPTQHSNTDPFLIQNLQKPTSPAQIQTIEIDLNNNDKIGPFSPVKAGITQGSMPWIQMNWGSPPARQENQHQTFYNKKITPPIQGFSPNQKLRPNQALQNSSELRKNYQTGQTSNISPPINGGFPYNPFEPTRKGSLIPDQRQNVLYMHQKTTPDQVVGFNGYQGQQRNVHHGQDFLHNQPNLQQNGFSPSHGFIPSHPVDHVNPIQNQANARLFHQENLINLTSPPEQNQRQNPGKSNLPMGNKVHQHVPHFNLSHADNVTQNHFVPQEIMTQSTQHNTAGQSLLFQSLWDPEGSHLNNHKEGAPLQVPSSFGLPNDSLVQHSQMTSPESGMTSGFDSYTSQGFENPVSINTDWAASPRTSDVMPRELMPNQVPAQVPAQVPPHVPAQAPAHGKLFPISHVEELLLQETGDGISLIPFGDLQIGRQIGTGGYKDCFAGTYKGEIVAVGELKVTQFTREDFLEIKNEVNVLKQVYHENIVRFIGIAKGPEKLCILTEFCQKGDLFDQFRRDPKPAFEIQMQIMYDIALGVAYLHARRPSIIHRDLKSMNILINKEGKAKINDFGLARIRSRVRSIAHTQCGTPNWQAPEIFAAKPSYTEKVDVYAVGLIFWEILQWGAQPFPFSDIPESSLEIAIRDKRLRPSFSHIQSCPTQLYQLIVQMWDHEATARPSMAIVVDQLGQLLD